MADGRRELSWSYGTGMKFTEPERLFPLMKGSWEHLSQSFRRAKSSFMEYLYNRLSVSPILCRELFGVTFGPLVWSPFVSSSLSIRATSVGGTY